MSGAALDKDLAAGAPQHTSRMAGYTEDGSDVIRFTMQLCPKAQYVWPARDVDGVIRPGSSRIDARS